MIDLMPKKTPWIVGTIPGETLIPAELTPEYQRAVERFWLAWWQTPVEALRGEPGRQIALHLVADLGRLAAARLILGLLDTIDLGETQTERMQILLARVLCLPGHILAGSETIPGPGEIVIEGLEFEEVWPLRAVGDGVDPMNYLLGRVDCRGASFHLDAIEVKVDEQGEQRSVDPDYEGKLEGADEVSNGSDPWETVTIAGREYVLVLTPFTS